jgi:heptaprenyl diphosphate synthase
MKNDEVGTTFFVLTASSLQIIESFFPHPVPGVRLGLANIVSFLAVVYFGIFKAIEVSILRTIISSLFLGTFLSPSFILSFFSAITSTISMWILYKISLNTIFKFSPLGINVFSAVVHNITQLLLVYIFFIQQKNIFLFLPLLLVSAIVTGWLTGSLALEIVKKVGFDNIFLIDEISVLQNKEEKVFNADWLKLILFLIFFVLVFLLKKIYVQASFFIIFFIFYLLQKNDINVFWKNVKNVLWLIIFSFLILLFLHPYGKAFLKWKFLIITFDGINLSFLYNLRILNIVFLSSWLVQQYSIQELNFIIKKIVFFYPMGGRIVSNSLFLLPNFLEDVKSQVKKINFNSPKRIFENIVDIFIKILFQPTGLK